MLLATFVKKPRFSGTCNNAANWLFLGDTQGRGRLARLHRNTESIKRAWIYQLASNCRRQLCGAEIPNRRSMIRHPKYYRNTADIEPTFKVDYLDVNSWQHRCRVAPRDPRPDARMLDVFKPFLAWLLDQGSPRKTLQTHRDRIEGMGGEIIRHINVYPKLRKRPPMRVLMENLGKNGGPQIYPSEAEHEQPSFVCIRRKLQRFLLDSRLKLSGR